VSTLTTGSLKNNYDMKNYKPHRVKHIAGYKWFIKGDKLRTLNSNIGNRY